MEDIKVLKNFRDAETGQLHNAGETISRSKERASVLISRGYAKAIPAAETKEEKAKPATKEKKGVPETKEEKKFE